MQNGNERLFICLITLPFYFSYATWMAFVDIIFSEKTNLGVETIKGQFQIIDNNNKINTWLRFMSMMMKYKLLERIYFIRQIVHLYMCGDMNEPKKVTLN